MDGALKPNNRLEEAERLLSLPAIDNLAADGAVAYCSSGSILYRLHPSRDGYGAERVEEFSDIVTCIAVGGGRLAVGFAGKGILLSMGAGAWQHVDLAPELSRCMVAAAFAPNGALLVCIGSRRLPAAEWKRDLMQHGSSGCLLAVDPQGNVEIRREDLAFPYGVCAAGDGRILVGESWRHRILFAEDGWPALDDLPAYPARISPAADGGLWLALFAPRRQLFEMVLREDDYRQEMLATIPPADWIGPELNSDGGADQPLQAGSIRQMGIIKPWAPSRSYGLVVKCDAACRPVASWHSRADGSMHGVTSVVECGGDVLATARGADTLLRLWGASA
jgi:hypothetical protein